MRLSPSICVALMAGWHGWQVCTTIFGVGGAIVNEGMQRVCRGDTQGAWGGIGKDEVLEDGETGSEVGVLTDIV